MFNLYIILLYSLCNYTNIVFKMQFFLKMWETAIKNVLTYEGRCMSQKVTSQNIIIYANI